MKTIPLTKGYSTIVDDEDYESLIKWKWCVVQTPHPRASRRGPGNTRIYMARQIMGAPDDVHVDHANGDTLDDRRANLRLCSVAENMRNSKKPKNNTTGYKGVYKVRNRFRAAITVDSGYVSIGTYPTAKDAAHVYDFAAQLFHGEFARLNFPLVDGNYGTHAIHSGHTEVAPRP
jgi:hypothetical protein